MHEDMIDALNVVKKEIFAIMTVRYRWKGVCRSIAQEVLDTIEKGYKLGYHKAAKMAEIGLWAEMWGVTDVKPEILSKLFIKPFGSIQEALDQALKQKGEGADLLFLMDGSLTVPMISK